MVMKQFVGTWKLVSSEFKSSDRQVFNPLGNDAVGILMYDAISLSSLSRFQPVVFPATQILAFPACPIRSLACVCDCLHRFFAE